MQYKRISYFIRSKKLDLKLREEHRLGVLTNRVLRRIIVFERQEATAAGETA